MFKITEDGFYNIYADGSAKEIKYREKDFPVILPPIYESATDCMCDQLLVDNLGYSSIIQKHPIWKQYVIVLTGFNKGNNDEN